MQNLLAMMIMNSKNFELILTRRAKAYSSSFLQVVLVYLSDCNLGIEFSIPGSRIEKFVIPQSHFGIRLTDWSSFWYPQLTYFMHRALTEDISKL